MRKSGRSGGRSTCATIKDDAQSLLDTRGQVRKVLVEKLAGAAVAQHKDEIRCADRWARVCVLVAVNIVGVLDVLLGVTLRFDIDLQVPEQLDRVSHVQKKIPLCVERGAAWVDCRCRRLWVMVRDLNAIHVGRAGIGTSCNIGGNDKRMHRRSLVGTMPGFAKR